MQIETTLSDRVERYLDLATGQAKLTAQNMANVDTPGYKAVGIDFEAEMRKAMSGVTEGLPSTAAARVVREGGLVARPDGNNVSMDRESLNLAEAQLKFRTGVAVLRQQYQLVMDAIHMDK
ncbi:MAG TPA: flagellar basal body rod protein FlgB [Terracidiphilus sp.]